MQQGAVQVVNPGIILRKFNKTTFYFRIQLRCLKPPSPPKRLSLSLFNILREWIVIQMRMSRLIRPHLAFLWQQQTRIELSSKSTIMIRWIFQTSISPMSVALYHQPAVAPVQEAHLRDLLHHNSWSNNRPKQLLIIWIAHSSWIKAWTCNKELTEKRPLIRLLVLSQQTKTTWCNTQISHKLSIKEVWCITITSTLIIRFPLAVVVLRPCSNIKFKFKICLMTKTTKTLNA